MALIVYNSNGTAIYPYQNLNHDSSSRIYLDSRW
jgi:hypothetical protein